MTTVFASRPASTGSVVAIVDASSAARNRAFGSRDRSPPRPRRSMSGPPSPVRQPSSESSPTARVAGSVAVAATVASSIPQLQWVVLAILATILGGEKVLRIPKGFLFCLSVVIIMLTTMSYLLDWAPRHAPFFFYHSLASEGWKVLVWVLLCSLLFANPGTWFWYAASATGAYIHFQSPYYYLVTCTDCNIWFEYTDTIPDRCWTVDAFSIYWMVLTIILVESSRWNISCTFTRHASKVLPISATSKTLNSVVWVLALFLLGYGVVLPLFWMELRKAETSVGIAARRGRNFSWLYFIQVLFSLATYLSLLAQWSKVENGFANFMDVTFQKVSSTNNTWLIILVWITNGLYMLPDVSSILYSERSPPAPVVVTKTKLSANMKFGLTGSLPLLPAWPAVFRRSNSVPDFKVEADLTFRNPAAVSASVSDLQRLRLGQPRKYMISLSNLRLGLTEDLSPALLFAQWLLMMTMFYHISSTMGIFMMLRENSPRLTFKQYITKRPSGNALAWLHGATTSFLLCSALCYTFGHVVRLDFATLLCGSLILTSVLNRWLNSPSRSRTFSLYLTAKPFRIVATLLVVYLWWLNLILVWGRSQFLNQVLGMEFAALSQHYEKSGTFTLLMVGNVIWALVILFRFDVGVARVSRGWRVITFAALLLLVARYSSGPQGKPDTPMSTWNPSQNPFSGREWLHGGKTHGCVRAEFQMDSTVGAQYQRGVFQPNAQYPAYLHFASSTSPTASDAVPAVRGVTMKLGGLPNAQSQDFVLISSDFIHSGRPDDHGPFLPVQSIFDFFHWAFPSLGPGSWRLNAAYLMYRMAMVGMDVRNPLNAQYFSATPYRLGTAAEAVKYSIRPCLWSHNKTAAEAMTAGDKERKFELPETHLREAMRSHLAAHDACFEFLVQSQTDPWKMPVEDPTVSWTSRWVKLGTVRVPAQRFLRRDQHEFCQSMAFSSWNALPEHKPLGSMSLARKPTNNLAATVVITGREEFTGELIPGPFDGAGDTLMYQAAHYPEPWTQFPLHIKDLPAHEEFVFKKKKHIYGKISRYHATAYADGLRTSKPFREFTEPDDYVHLFPNQLATEFPVPSVVRRWKQDVEFARQFLAGANPTTIRHVTDARPLPAALNLSSPVIDRINREVLRGNGTFESLRRAGRLFFVDYEILEGIISYEDRVFFPAIAVFYLDDTRTLMPLLIQLTRTARASEVFMPSDEPLVWLFAKMHVAHADGLISESIEHLLNVHLMLEPLIVAFHRQLSTSHPVYRLVDPHMHQTLAINDFGRSTMIAEGGLWDKLFGPGMNGGFELMQAAYRVYNHSARSFPVELQLRGFGPVDQPGSASDPLPGYHYRDDGFKLWNAIRDYVSEVLSSPDIYGGTPQQSAWKIAADAQLAALWRELSDPARVFVPGLPSLGSLEDLVDFVSTFIFTATVHHGAVSQGQYDYCAFAPNRPLLMTKPMPHRREDVTEAYIMSALPNEAQAKETLLTMHLLSFPPTATGEGMEQTVERCLLHLDDEVFYKEPYRKLKQRLDIIETQIEERNRQLEVPYTYMLPHNIPGSTDL
eukprot:TRINITY_DN2526_c0_g1_i5.p1 TRINITY_DN2526_c0_g1~~TRINITY_DN2526_c0_g1_i5.p1  ORF type:complete len:1551 (-),score=496.26 TRINITY_DN2526_c0_g1_i5:713-5365(-)